MPRKAKELSAVEVRRMSTPGLFAVGGVAGLQLQISASNSKSWILRTMVGTKRRDIGLGAYPDISLAEARESARVMKAKIVDGVDPVQERREKREQLLRAEQQFITFQDAAYRAYDARKQEFSNPKHRADWIRSLKLYAFPVLGSTPVDRIDVNKVLQVLEPIWAKKTETATRVRQRMESVLSWATVSGYRSGDNPARWQDNLKELLPNPSKVRKTSHFAALDWKQVPTFLADLKRRDGMGARALEFIIYTAARSGEVRLATWDEIDLEQRLWTIPEARMKARKAHRIPLAEPAIALLKALPRFEGTDMVFSAPRGGALSDMSISAVTKRMKVPAVPHGFRSSFKDWCRSNSSLPDEVSELALAHVNSDATRAAYARDELLPQRIKLLGEWCAFVVSTSGVDYGRTQLVKA